MFLRNYQQKKILSVRMPEIGPVGFISSFHALEARMGEVVKGLQTLFQAIADFKDQFRENPTVFTPMEAEFGRLSSLYMAAPPLNPAAFMEGAINYFDGLNSEGQIPTVQEAQYSALSQSFEENCQACQSLFTGMFDLYQQSSEVLLPRDLPGFQAQIQVLRTSFLPEAEGSVKNPTAFVEEAFKAFDEPIVHLTSSLEQPRAVATAAETQTSPFSPFLSPSRPSHPGGVATVALPVAVQQDLFSTPRPLPRALVVQSAGVLGRHQRGSFSPSSVVVRGRLEHNLRVSEVFSPLPPPAFGSQRRVGPPAFDPTASPDRVQRTALPTGLASAANSSVLRTSRPGGGPVSGTYQAAVSSKVGKEPQVAQPINDELPLGSGPQPAPDGGKPTDRLLDHPKKQKGCRCWPFCW